MAELFNVIFAGEIAGRADPAAVRANVGKLFNASEAVLDKLFSGQPVVIKKMADRATAMDLRARMKLAGANTRLVAVDEQGRPLPEGAAASAPAATPAPAAPRPAPPQAPTPVRPAPAPAVPAPAASSAGGWDIAPVGVTLGVPAGPPPPPPVLPAASIAPVGSDMISAAEKPVVTPVQVDISSISMAPVGSDVLRENERPVVTPVQVDIGGISIAPPGADLDQLHDDRPPVNPDISHIKLV